MAVVMSGTWFGFESRKQMCVFFVSDRQEEVCAFSLINN